MLDDPADTLGAWRVDARGREYLPGEGGRGLLWRQPGETVEQGRAREISERLEREAGVPRKRRRGKGRKPDPAPGGATAAAKPPKPKATVEQLAAGVEIALAPVAAAYGRMVLDCDFCAVRMRAAAPAAAMDIARMADHNPLARGVLERWHGLVAGIMGGGGQGLAELVVVPVLHHAPLPEPIVDLAGPLMGVPPRRPGSEGPPEAHVHGSADAAPAGMGHVPPAPSQPAFDRRPNRPPYAAAPAA
jgi:hypothetical protein